LLLALLRSPFRRSLGGSAPGAMTAVDAQAPAERSSAIAERGGDARLQSASVGQTVQTAALVVDRGPARQPVVEVSDPGAATDSTAALLGPAEYAWPEPLTLEPVRSVPEVSEPERPESSVSDSKTLTLGVTEHTQPALEVTQATQSDLGVSDSARPLPFVRAAEAPSPWPRATDSIRPVLSPRQTPARTSAQPPVSTSAGLLPSTQTAPLINHAPPMLETALLRPWESTDGELARVIAALPPAMAEAVVAAGVLDQPASDAFQPWAPTAPLSAPSYSAAVALDMHTTRPPTLSHSHTESERSEWQSPLNPHHAPQPTAGSVVAHGFSASRTVGASQAAPVAGIARAPLDRQPDNAPATTAAPLGPTIAGSGGVTGSPGGAAPQQQDLDRLADDVYARLRWRLIGERERHMGDF